MCAVASSSAGASTAGVAKCHVFALRGSLAPRGLLPMHAPVLCFLLPAARRGCAHAGRTRAGRRGLDDRVIQAPGKAEDVRPTKEGSPPTRPT